MVEEIAVHPLVGLYIAIVNAIRAQDLDNDNPSIFSFIAGTHTTSGKDFIRIISQDFRDSPTIAIIALEDGAEKFTFEWPNLCRTIDETKILDLAQRLDPQYRAIFLSSLISETAALSQKLLAFISNAVPLTD